MERRNLISLFTILGCAVFPALAAATPQGTVPPPPPPQGVVPPPPPQGAVPPPPPPPPPTVYKSDATKAWGETAAPDAGTAEPATPPASPTAPTPTPADADREALKTKCDATLKEGKSLPECKALELDIVFSGGMGTKAVAAPALPQASDAESKKLVEKKLAIEEEAQLVSDGKMDLWAVSRREPPLLEKAPTGFLAVGVRVGYPFLVARGSGLKQGYKPIIHTSIEGAYQALRFLQIALVADLQALRGGSTEEKEYLPTDVQYEDGEARPLRDIGSLLDDYIGVGVRPTVRLGGEWRSFQASLGLGFGWHFLHASGRWRSKLDAGDRANSTDATIGEANWKGNDYAVYSFEESDNGAYSVFEFTAMYRLLEGHLGAGIMLEYSILLHGRTSPEVTIESQYGLDPPLGNPDNPAGWTGYTAQKDDYEETLVRHLGAMNFITLGAVADYRF
jgi:hypothetical protein